MRGIWAAKQGSRVSTEQRLIVEGTLLTGEGWDVNSKLLLGPFSYVSVIPIFM